MKPDFGATAADYASYRAGFPESFFTRLSGFGIGLPDQSIVDLGTGTGTLARGFARRGCRVTAIDPSPALLDEARRLDREAGQSVDYFRSVNKPEIGLSTALQRFGRWAAMAAW